MLAAPTPGLLTFTPKTDKEELQVIARAGLAHLARQARPALSEPAKQRALQLAQDLAQKYVWGARILPG